jgi:hypothetical protein
MRRLSGSNATAGKKGISGSKPPAAPKSLLSRGRNFVFLGAGGGRGAGVITVLKTRLEVVQNKTNRDEENESRETRIRNREAGIA